MQPPQPRQHSDIQMLQRQLMFTQLQEMQRKQQHGEYGDPREQNYINQLSLLNKQAFGVKATPIGDGSQVAMVGNKQFTRHGSPPIIQGFSQGLDFSHAQSPDVSLYGTPIATGNNLNQFSNIMPSSNFNNSFVGEPFNPSSGQGCMDIGAYEPKHVIQMKNSFGQVPFQGSHGEILPENFQHMNTMQRNDMIQESMRMQDQDQDQDQPGWPNRGMTSLGPLEEKILFNTDDNNCEASLGGSWSALMQSVVAEAPSSDTGAQEQWSGNPELPTDNQPSSYMDTGPSSKPQLQYHDLHTQGNFSRFQQSNHQSLKQRDGVCSDSSHGSIHQSPRNANNWSDCSPRQKHTMDESHLGQVSSLPQNNWPMQHQEHVGNDSQHKSVSSYANISQPGYELKVNLGLAGQIPWDVFPRSNQPPTQPFQGLSYYEHGYVEQIKPDTQRNPKASEEVEHQNSVVSNSVLVDTTAGLNSPSATSYSRETMVDQLKKDEASIETRSGMQYSIPSLEQPQPETLDASVTHSYNNFSISQGVGSYSSRPVVVSGNVSNLIGTNPSGQEFPTMETVPTTHPSATENVTWKTVAPNSWSVLPFVPQSEPHSGPSNSLPSPDSSTSSLQNPAGASQLHHNSATASSVMTGMHRQAFTKVHRMDNRNQNVSAGDFEAFGRSLRASHGLHQNSLLLHQEHSLKNVETDPRSRLSQLNLSSSEAGPAETDNRSAHSSSSMASNPLEQAASWFKHYGALKDGQMLPLYDPRVAKDAVQQLPAGRYFGNMQLNNSIVQVNSTAASQGSNIWPTIATTSLAAQQLSPLCMLPQNLAVLRSKKRKIAAINLLPWHKEVTQGLPRLLNISTAEAKWVNATNRIKEKLEDEAEVIGNVNREPRAKRRLTLTTQLMQQILRPAPPAAILSEAGSNSVNITYVAARSALRDACRLTHYSDNNMPSKQLKEPERPCKQNFSKSVENFINQAKRLEGDFLRMEQRSLFVDIKMESRELEKFYIVNNLAKIHRNGHTAVTDSSSSISSSSLPKPFPRRYVVASPMPRTVPEDDNCLSL